MPAGDITRRAGLAGRGPRNRVEGERLGRLERVRASYLPGLRLYCPRVGWSTTLGAWARREAVLVSFLLAAAAIAALAGPLGAAWLGIAGVGVAAVGALTRVVIAVQRTRLESARERAVSAHRFRVLPAPISEIDPTLIGVDPAAQTILAGGVVPEYIGRAVDGELRKAVQAALGGSGSWLVVVVGASKVGKSRTLFHALRWSPPAGELEFIAPVDGAALRSFLTPGEGVGRRLVARTVLWLDDLEPFLDQGVTLQMLREWHAGAPGRIVAATYGGKGSEQIARASAGGLATLAFDVLQQARQIRLEATTARELGVLRSAVTAQAFDDVERHGLAAYLVAGPALERKLATGRHAPGEDACPEGVALVHAAIDWARCGRTDPISEEVLRNLWPSHLHAGIRATDEVFDVGLAWALRPVAGTIALLQYTSSYTAYDYVVRLVRDKPGAEPPRDRSWAAAVQTAAGAQAFAVAVAAYRCGRLEDAVTALAPARESSIDEVAAAAGYNLGFVLGELGRSEQAIEVYDQVLARFADAPEPALRKAVAQALALRKAVAQALSARQETK